MRLSIHALSWALLPAAVSALGACSLVEDAPLPSNTHDPVQGGDPGGEEDAGTGANSGDPNADSGWDAPPDATAYDAHTGGDHEPTKDGSTGSDPIQDGSPSDDPGGDDPDPQEPLDCPAAEDFFASSVQSKLAICRTCHVPNGLAAVKGGDNFMLGKDKSGDFERLRTSWVALGGNNPVSRILSTASGAEPHTGGAPWKVGSETYNNVALLLRLFADPRDCGE